MRKTSFFSAVLSLFLLVPASITWAQTISSQKGLTAAVFTTSNGTIKVYLPDDIRPGDMISGHINANPAGNTARQIENNLAALKKYSIGINNEKFAVEDLNRSFQFLVHSDRPMTDLLDLFNPSGNKAAELTIPPTAIKDQQPVTAECMIPSHALTGSPLRVTGNFDGNSSNTNWTLDNKPMAVITESPRQSVIFYPADAANIHTINGEENGKTICSGQVSGVQLNVSAGKLDLHKGETTFIDVTISNLQHLPDTALLTLTNISTNVITMTGGNNILVPIPPPVDTMNGTYTRRFNVQSIRTGTFSVNVNLNLPETPSINSSSTPGTTTVTKKCDCNCVAKIEKSVSSSNQIVYKANVSGGCSGFCGPGTISFPVCPPGITKYSWVLTGDKNAAGIIGTADRETVKILEKNKDSAYSVVLTVTTECDCNVSCKSSDVIMHPGTTGGGPGKDSNPPDTLSKPPGKDMFPPYYKPPVNPDPTYITQKIKCGCKCSITTPIIIRDKLNFKATNVTGACKSDPDPCPPKAIPAKCDPPVITYHWTVSFGKEVIEIVGNANGPSVTIKMKGKGMYMLTVTATVTCADGTSCQASASYFENPANICGLIPEEKMEPLMNGGLKPGRFDKPKAIHRDDYVELGAIGVDYDQLKWTCHPSSSSDCKLTESDKTIVLNGRIKFAWRITGGEGSFVKLGCLPDNSGTAEGENVIFKPPFIPLPASGVKKVITTIVLSTIDDNPTQPMDPTVDSVFTIITSRSTSNPDEYTVEIKSNKPDLPAKPGPGFTDGTCKASGPEWDRKDNLKKPEIKSPGLTEQGTDKDKMVIGQWIVLEANDQRDEDSLTIKCVPAGDCKTEPWGKVYEDKVEWNWSAAIVGEGKDKGRFVSDPTGRYIIYEAPMELPKVKENDKEKEVDYVDIKIKVIVSNPDDMKIKDEEVQEGEIILRVYKAGIKLSNTPLVWLPEDKNNVELRSQLMYKDGEWKPGFPHMCRIHYFELMNVSEEKGVCMNFPAFKEANECRDLFLKKGEGLEAFNDKTDAKKCSLKELYQQARTEKPEKDYTVKVHSLDFGAYGFLRSVANTQSVTQAGKPVFDDPVYISVPVKPEDVNRANGKKKITTYGDDRVTIPYDNDENHICDNGWETTTMIIVNDELRETINPVTDPEKITDDMENDPAGDGFPGDGLTAYEEYRGFKTTDKHIRTNYKKKDIFIQNANNLPLTLYTKISGLDVHEVNEKGFCQDSKRERVINFNCIPEKTIVPNPIHIDQKGVVLVDGKKYGLLLGVAVYIDCPRDNPVCGVAREAPPNWIKEVRIFTETIKDISANKNLNPAKKLAVIVAHELLHANNLYHHGETTPGLKPEHPGYEDNMNGRRSGDLTCVMRYDNVGTPKDKDKNCKPLDPAKAAPEELGTTLCKSRFAPDNKCFGDAAPLLGDCVHQLRVSGRGEIPTRYGNREPVKKK